MHLLSHDLNARQPFRQPVTLDRDIPAWVAALGEGIGQSPLVDLYTDSRGGGLFAKCEWSNPTGTVKDRAAFSMLARVLARYQTAEEAARHLHILEYSGGSLAFSIAGICQRAGVRCTLVLGNWMGESQFARLRRMGAELVICPKEKGFLEVILVAQRMAQEDPRFTFLNQHENVSNVAAHLHGTGQEVLRQLPPGRPLDAVVAAIGTGATLVGTGLALHPHNPDLELHGVTPLEQRYGTLLAPNGLRKFAGSSGLGNGLKQHFIEDWQGAPIIHHALSWNEAAETVLFVKERLGIRIGSSAAANFRIALDTYKRLGIGARVLVFFPSAGTDEEWNDVCSNYTAAVMETPTWMWPKESES